MQALCGRRRRRVDAIATFHARSPISEHPLPPALGRRISWPVWLRAGRSRPGKLQRFGIFRRSRVHGEISVSLGAPTQLAAKIFDAGRELLARETGSTRFRLIGIGVSALAPAQGADPADLVDQRGLRSAAAEHAVDRLREKFGRAAVIRGIVLEEDQSSE